jgi:hypothetical protein
MADIRYQFIADGVQTVRDGFKSIGKDAKDAGREADEAMRRMRTSTRETARETARSAGRGKDLAQQVAKDQERSAKYLLGVRDRTLREEQRQTEQAERLVQRNAARAEAQKQRAIVSATGKRRQEIAKEIGERRQHETRLEQIARSAADRRVEGERRHTQKLDQIKRQSAGRLDSIAERAKEATASRERARAFDGELLAKRRAHEIDKKREDIRSRARSEVGAEIRGSIRGAVIGGAVAAGAVGLGVTGAAARDALRLQEVSNRLSISARGAGEEAVDPNVLRKEFEATAIRTPGVKSIDVAEAVSQFVSRTGNLDMARKSQGVFATVASASGSSIQDVATAASDLFQKFDINTIDGMADAMAALAFQGKNGAFELKDAAGQFAKMSAAASRFGLDKGAGGVRTLGGLAQIAMTATGSPDVAATAVNAMLRQFTAAGTQKDFKRLGVDVFKDKNKTQTNDIRGLLVDTIFKARGNQTTLGHIFGDEGMAAVSPMLSKFNEAQTAARGRGLSEKDALAEAKGALQTYLDGMINAPGGYDELQKDAAQAQQDASAKLTATWEKLSSGIGQSVLPVLGALADRLANSPDAIDAFVGTVENLAAALEFGIAAIEAWADFLGMSVKKKKTPEQVREEERKKATDLQQKLKRFDEKRGGSWDEEAKLRAQGKTKEADAMAKRLFATAGMDDERQTLAAKFEAQKKRVGEANAGVDASRDQQYNIRSAAAFAEQYGKMLGPEEYKGQNELRARMVGQSLRDGALVDSPFTRGGALEGETEAATQFRVNQARARREDLQNAGVSSQGQSGAATADKGGGSLMEAAAKILAAAQKMEGAAGKVAQQGQASIVPQP